LESSSTTPRPSDTNNRIDDLRSHVDVRFGAMESLFTEKLLRVEQVLEARLKHPEENL